MKGNLKLLVLADIDHLHWRAGMGQADLIISCGDVSDSLMLEAAEAFHCPRIFAVKGNHDSHASFPEPVIDLHLNKIEFKGITFGGFNGSWKYKPNGPFLYEQDEAVLLLEDFPAVEVFVSHNSPWGIHDKQDEVHDGFKGLNRYIERAGPKLFVHGHQHCNQETIIGQTKVIGVYGNRSYRLGDPENSKP